MHYPLLILLKVDFGAVTMLLLALVLMLLGGLIVIASLLLARGRLRFRKNATAVQGVVLRATHDVKEVGRSGSLIGSLFYRTKYFATIKASYEPTPGTSLECTDKVDIPTGGRDYLDGDAITVFYDPRNPKKAKLSQVASAVVARKVLVGSVIGLFVVGFGALLVPAHVFEPNTQATQTNLGSSPRERASRGEALYQALLTRHVAVAPGVTGMLRVAGLDLRITADEWSKLSREHQIDLTYYVEGLLPKVRANPETYVTVTRSDQFYKISLQDARNLCDSCWSIVTGVLQKDGSINNGDFPVQGDESWERHYSVRPEFKAKNLGSKASRFRQQ